MTETTAIALSIGIFAVILVCSVLMTGWIRHYAMRRFMLDIPNSRSSHTAPTPRGGGGAIVILVLATTGILVERGLLPLVPGFVLAIGGGVLGLLGWLDDRHSLPVASRALVHVVVAAATVYFLKFGTMHGAALTQLSALNFVYLAVDAIALAWLINLYNFMDGSDGLAGGEAVSVSVAGAFLFAWSGQDGWTLLCLALAASSLGFLAWNWSHAKIFMGDVGSCFLGYVFGVMALSGRQSADIPRVTWLILLSVFAGDATFTLAWRLLNGARWYSAHRTHAYQRLLQLGFTHRHVAILTITYNMVILWPIALASVIWKNVALWFGVASMVLTGGIWLYVQWLYAARKEERDTAS